jgi:hypothetical protein
MTLAQWQSLGYDLNSMIANPEDQIFVDHTNGNFHLLQNAQAVDAGTNLVSSVVLEDLDNISRPQGTGFDIGCYEYTGTTEVVEENNPESFQLFQNYPNPFNPSTIINYTVPKTSFVTIKVYDNLGEEIETLVNESMPMGNYEINFDVNNLSSGVYFYRMISGSYAETKKMLLLR